MSYIHTDEPVLRISYKLQISYIMFECVLVPCTADRRGWQPQAQDRSQGTQLTQPFAKIKFPYANLTTACQQNNGLTVNITAIRL